MHEVVIRYVSATQQSVYISYAQKPLPVAENNILEVCARHYYVHIIDTKHVKSNEANEIRILESFNNAVY